MSRHPEKAVVFLDRDGTINVNLPFPNVNTPDKLVLLEGAGPAIKAINDLGLRVMVVTNQAGINNPENPLSWETFFDISKTLDAMIEKSGARIDATYCCPHEREENCSCRKPGTGLFEKGLAETGGMDLRESFIVGDRTDDILAGKKLGMTTILVLTGHGEDTRARLEGTSDYPDYIAGNLLEASSIIAECVGLPP